MPRAAIPKRPRTAPQRRQRIAEILRILDESYPDATCALRHNNAWELLVATILSAQCTDTRVNMVMPALLARYPTILDMASANQRELAETIRSTGFFNNKAKSLIGAARRILDAFSGEVPRSMEELLTVPGAARKTANVVLGTAYGIASGVVVDTHVARIARRLDLSAEKTPEKIERDLMPALPEDRWILFSHQVILHGRALCAARAPRCASCPLGGLCYAGDRTA